MRSWVSTGQMAEALGCSRNLVSAYCREGMFEGAIQTPGGHWRIPSRHLLEASGKEKQLNTALDKRTERTERTNTPLTGAGVSRVKPDTNTRRESARQKVH